MNRYLRVSLICLTICILSLYYSYAHGQTSARTWCVPSSIFCAWTWAGANHDDVRIAVTHISVGVDHSQAEALIDGQWTPLTEIWNGECMAVVISTRHFDIEPYRYLTLKSWINEQIRYAK